MSPTSRESLFSLPNQLSLSRFLLAVVLFVLIHFESWIACIAILFVAFVTDWLDGYFARARGLTSEIGRSLDPLADKVLTGGAFIFLLPRGTAEGWLTPWMVTLVICRELIITAVRGYMEKQGVPFGAERLGKVKMLLQCVALVAIFTSLVLILPELDIVRNVLVWAMVLATALSGVEYLYRASVLLSPVHTE